jgi:hypothetical protein
MNPFEFLVICVAGWMNRNQQERDRIFTGRNPCSQRTVGQETVVQ